MAADTLILETIILGTAKRGKWCGFAAVYEPAVGNASHVLYLNKIANWKYQYYNIL
jgi:hypothetical protein